MYHDTRSVYSDIHLPEKNNLVTPRPITDLGIRKALKNDDDLASLKVPPKDEKILALIAKKGEFEKKYWKQRLKNSLAWDTEKLDSDRLRLEKRKNHEMKVEIMREEDRQHVQMKKLERQKKRLKKKTQLLTEMEKSSKVTEKQLKKQHKLKEKKLRRLAEKEDENKERQEKNWWDINSREYDRKLQEKVEHDRKRLHALEKRDELIKDEVERVTKENDEERMYFTERYVIYEKKEKANQKALTAKIERKLSTAQSNHEQHMKGRLQEIKQDVDKEDERLQHALKSQHKQEKQNHKRVMKMLEKTQQGIDQATETISKAYEALTKQIRDEREEKELEQRKNLKKIQKEAKKRTKQIKKEIKHEEEKMQGKQEERNKIMDKTRTVAHGTRLLRNKLRDTYGAENMDKKVFRVERFHSLGTRPSTQDWNTSSISLL